MLLGSNMYSPLRKGVWDMDIYLKVDQGTSVTFLFTFKKIFFMNIISEQDTIFFCHLLENVIL